MPSGLFTTLAAFTVTSLSVTVLSTSWAEAENAEERIMESVINLFICTDFVMVQSYNLLKRKPIYESDIYLTIG